MAQTEHCQDVETITTAGFDGLFQGGSTVEPGQNQGGSTAEPGLTLKEAVEFYKISEKSVRIRIGQGKIAAKKVPGPNGPEWRIYPNGLPEAVPERNHPGTTVEDAVPESGSTVEPEWYQGSVEGELEEEEVEVVQGEKRAERELEKLLSVIQEQAAKLEAANYRIGYLEAQTEGFREQVKLLTDRKRKSWWATCWSWFIGQSENSS